MKLIVAGLSRTGTTSIHLACEHIGLVSKHCELDKASWITKATPSSYRVYDDVDVVSDLPVAVFFAELAQAYPEANVLLSVRPEDEWWASVLRYYENRHSSESLPLKTRAKLSATRAGRRHLRHIEVRSMIRTHVYGSASPDERLWRAAYRSHNERVRKAIAAERFFEFDISAGHGWSELLAPLGLTEVPEVPFPRANATVPAIDS